MTNICEYKSNIKHFQQVGPTCGLYASIMILNRWMELKVLPKHDVNKLIINIYKVVTDSKNPVSKTGEIFTQESVRMLISAISRQYPNNHFDYETVSFDTSEIMQRKIQEAFSKDSLILFPYCKEWQKSKEGIMHWSVIDSVSGGYILGQQGCRNSYIHFKRSKDESQIVITPEELFEVHNKIKKNFSWNEYFHTSPFIASNAFGGIFQKKLPQDKELTDLILKNIKERKRGLKNKEVEIDMIGKMVIISKPKTSVPILNELLDSRVSSELKESE